MFSLSIVDINTLAWIMVAVVNLLTAYLAWQASRAAKVTNASMLQVVHATDGMKDALVAATAKASFSAGAEHAQAITEGKADVLAQGIKDVAAAAARPLAAAAAAAPAGGTGTIS
jgi:hypothetical protein